MTTNNLKKLLIAKIDDTNDEELLKAIYKLLDYNSSAGEIFKINSEQKEAIEEGRTQIEKGEFVSNEDLEKEIDKWLNG
jgi:hypothetical protein